MAQVSDEADDSLGASAHVLRVGKIHFTYHRILAAANFLDGKIGLQPAVLIHLASVHGRHGWKWISSR